MDSGKRAKVMETPRYNATILTAAPTGKERICCDNNNSRRAQPFQASIRCRKATSSETSCSLENVDDTNAAIDRSFEEHSGVGFSEA